MCNRQLQQLALFLFLSLSLLAHLPELEPMPLPSLLSQLCSSSSCSVYFLPLPYSKNFFCARELFFSQQTEMSGDHQQNRHATLTHSILWRGREAAKYIPPQMRVRTHPRDCSRFCILISTARVKRKGRRGRSK